VSGGHLLALAGCLLSAFVVYDLLRGTTGFRDWTFARAQQSRRYWLWLGVTAWLALICLIGAVREW